MQRRTDVAVIGAGQAGLAMSSCLTAAGIDHLVIERGRVGERWRSERWQSLRLITPNWMTRLPGSRPHISDPDGFMGVAAFARFLVDYSRMNGVPVATAVEVLSLTAEGAGYRLVTDAGTISARAVVIATGAHDRPAVPSWAGALPKGIAQLTPDGYRNADALREGGVLVVGASATGVQLAREIRVSGRPVTLSVGRHVRTPRRYRGRDLFDWLDAAGFLAERTAPGPVAGGAMQPSMQLCGPETLGLAELAAAGVRIVGRARDAEGTIIDLALTLEAERGASEVRRHRLLSVIDAHIAETGDPALPEPEAWQPPAPVSPAPGALDLASAGIRTVLWATGYRRSYPWLRLPVLDAKGEIRNEAGVTPVPGLFVLGLPFQRHRTSAFIDGVGRDAEALLPLICFHLRAAACRAA